MSLVTSGGIPSARNFAHGRKNFLSPAAKASIGSDVPLQSRPGPLLGKLLAPYSGGSLDPCFLFSVSSLAVPHCRTGLKTGHYEPCSRFSSLALTRFSYRSKDRPLQGRGLQVRAEG